MDIAGHRIGIGDRESVEGEKGKVDIVPKITPISRTKSREDVYKVLNLVEGNEEHERQYKLMMVSPVVLRHGPIDAKTYWEKGMAGRGRICQTQTV